LLRSTRNDPLKKHAAVFLDRDGTINEEVGYLDSLDKLRLFENTAEAIRLINENGMKAVVITNQSGVARGYFTEDFVKTVHRQMQETLQERGAFLDGFYYCPHHPTEGIGSYLKVCPCRKPEPGMLIMAAEELNIDLNRSYAVGDMLKDIEAANRVGAKGILVKTGYGLKAMEKDLRRTPREYPPEEKGNPDASEKLQPDYIAEDILDAVIWIMRDRKITTLR
jgi:D,D-heptose 1,7-bisphosphate phosphatase